MNIASFLSNSATTWADRPALALGSKIVQTYAEHGAEAAQLAGGLTGKLGLKQGDHVGIAMKKSPAYSTVLFAAWHAGLAAVPMNAKLHAREFNYILENAGITVCFVTNDLEPVIEEAAADLNNLQIINVDSDNFAELLNAEPIEMVDTEPDDLAWLFYTSGTTGRPKGAMLSHRNLIAMAGIAGEQQIVNGNWAQVSRIKTHDGGTLILRTDITEQKKAEELLHQSWRI